MNVLQKCCMRSLKENRVRTIVTIIGIMMATGLIMGVTCLVVTLKNTLIEQRRKEQGDYHYYFEGMDREDLKYFRQNSSVENVGVTAKTGFLVSEKKDGGSGPYLILRTLFDDEAPRLMGMKVTLGRLPEKDGEIAVSAKFLQSHVGLWKVGDEVSLHFNEVPDEFTAEFLRDEERLLDGEMRTYRIVGAVEWCAAERNAVDAFTRADPQELPERLDIYAEYSREGLKKHVQVTAGILGVPSDMAKAYYLEKDKFFPDRQVISAWEAAEKTARSVRRNEELLKLLSLNLDDPWGRALYSVALVIIILIMFMSVLCIRNSFSISLAEKMKMYGRLSSVGTTRRQMRCMVYYEAAFLGIFGIPLGILTGIFGVWIFVKLTGGLLAIIAEDVAMPHFGVSWAAVAVAAVMAVITVYYSAAQSANYASKISPMEAIRANTVVKRRDKKKLKTPGWIRKCFGAGGNIAYKNMMRARGKYRTVLWSIAIGTIVFIGLTTFVDVMREIYEKSLGEIDCQLVVYASGEDAGENLLQLARMEEVTRFQLERSGYLEAALGDLPLTERGKEKVTLISERGDGEKVMRIRLTTLGEEEYERYCREIGVDPAEAKDKAILQTYEEYGVYEGGERVTYRRDLAEFSPGDILTGKAAGIDDMKEYVNMSQEERQEYLDRKPELSLEVLCQTDIDPLSKLYSDGIRAIVSDAWMDAHPEVWYQTASLSVIGRNIDAVEEAAHLVTDGDSVYNFDREYRGIRNIVLAVEIFLFAFIGIVALVGVTNIFNVVTTNMELRAPEFAMLRSVGMETKEFQRMLRLEFFFLGGEGLLFGIPIGVLISYFIYDIISAGATQRMKYHPPFLGIALSAAVVFLLLGGIMRYSMKRIDRKNIIETIRNENI